MFTSFTRHIATKYKDQVSLTYRCSRCTQSFDSKRSVSIHFSKVHVLRPQENQRDPSILPSPTLHTTLVNAEGLDCRYCREKRPSMRSLGQHIRNQHAAEVSNDRDHQDAANYQSRQWTPAEHTLFVEALEKLGPSSNITIAKAIARTPSRLSCISRSS